MRVYVCINRKNYVRSIPNGSQDHVLCRAWSLLLQTRRILFRRSTVPSLSCFHITQPLLRALVTRKETECWSGQQILSSGLTESAFPR